MDAVGPVEGASPALLSAMSSKRPNDNGEELRNSAKRRETREENRAPSSSLMVSQAEQEMILRQRQLQQQQQQMQPFPFAAAPNQRTAASPARMFAATNPMTRYPTPDMRYLQEIRRAEEIVNMAQQQQQHRASGQGGPTQGGMYNTNEYGAPSRGIYPSWSQDVGGDMDSRSFAAAARPPGMSNHGIRSQEGLLNSLLLRQEEERLMNMKRGGALPDSFLPPNKSQGMDPPPWMRMPGNNQGGPALLQQQNLLDLQQPRSDASTQLKLPKQRKRHVKTFPVKLMEAITTHYNEDAVAWLPDGRSFVVVDPDLFCETILASTFKGGKYSSFVRKLNRWQFTRLISGTGTDCFHHALFQRGRPELCALITCSNEPSSSGSKTTPALYNSVKPSLAGVEKYFRASPNMPPMTGEEKANSEVDDDDKVVEKKKGILGPGDKATAGDSG